MIMIIRIVVLDTQTLPLCPVSGQPETPSIEVTKATSLQLPGIGGLQKQQLQMLLQAKMLQQQQGQANAATGMGVTEPVTSSPTDWSAVFGGNTANTGRTSGSNSFSVNDYFLSGYLFDGFGMGFGM
ncbi:uncharacterized protein LOC125682364 isoform X2 [Ostrea edulis]|uniref:uncharacterized protein LOC125682364 isoform X2 n=1 Tax=Ostrea edulis TaxID=37623 RepID=UPI002095E507|nr:uncharacterized protein LOC125682364 isoform X2 [Ostrea edulis]